MELVTKNSCTIVASCTYPDPYCKLGVICRKMLQTELTCLNNNRHTDKGHIQS